MDKLVLLMVALLAGTVGWWGGSWSGRDARAALAQAEAAGETAKKQLAEETSALRHQIAAIQSDYEGRLQAREAVFQRSKGELDQRLAQRDQTLAGLQRRMASTQTRLDGTVQRLADPALPVAERQALLAETERLKTELATERTRVAGLECTKVAVPAELLAPLQAGG